MDHQPGWPKWFYEPGKGLEGARICNAAHETPAGWAEAPTFAEPVLAAPIAPQPDGAAAVEAGKQLVQARRDLDALRLELRAAEDLDAAKATLIATQDEMIAALRAFVASIASGEAGDFEAIVLAAQDMAPVERAGEETTSPAPKRTARKAAPQ